MNAAWISLALLLLPALAQAGPQDDVAALVRTTIDHLSDGPTTLAKGATVIGIRANVFDYDSGKRLSGVNDGKDLDLQTHGGLWPLIMDKADPATSKRTLGKGSV